MIFIKRNIRLGYEFTGELKRKEILSQPRSAGTVTSQLKA